MSLSTIRHLSDWGEGFALGAGLVLCLCFAAVTIWSAWESRHE